MRRIISNFLIAICSIAAGMIMHSSASSAGEVIGWMDIAPSGDQIQITGRAYAREQTEVDFTLKIERTGQSGKTATKQTGRAVIEPGNIARLSTSSINIGAKDDVTILLTISRAGQVISSSAVHVGNP